MRVTRLLGYMSASLAFGMLACTAEPIEDEEFDHLDSAVESGDGSMEAVLSLQSDWGSGYCASVEVKNKKRDPSTSGWSVVVALNGSTNPAPWNVNVTPGSGQFTASNVGFNGTVALGGEPAKWGFCGSGSGRPSIVSVTGTGGTVDTGASSSSSSSSSASSSSSSSASSSSSSSASSSSSSGTGGGGGAGGSGGGGGAGGGGAGGGGGGGGGGSGAVEDSGASCPRPSLPAASSLPAFETHQDPFLNVSGSRITRKSEWACRRAEIKAQVEEYESGPKPATSKDKVTGTFSGRKLTVNVSEASKSISFGIDITRPAGAPSGPIPLVIGIGGNNLDQSVFTSNGVATATFNNNEMGAQNGGGSRGTGKFYDLYGSSHAASSMIAWAWGISRIIDALEKTPAANIDPKRIAVTGCSRNGKGALTAGAFDERIALTIPQESGAGGSASWRVSQAGKNAGENVQTLSNAAGEQPWFRANFGSNFGSRVNNLPFDHHMVMGLVAPRALLVLDNKIDWLGIDSTFTAGSIAHAIWEGLGVPDRMGYWQLGGHQHCQFPSAQRAMLEAYVKKFLVGGGTGDTNVLRSDGARADLARWMRWTAPRLE